MKIGSSLPKLSWTYKWSAVLRHPVVHRTSPAAIEFDANYMHAVLLLLSVSTSVIENPSLCLTACICVCVCVCVCVVVCACIAALHCSPLHSVYLLSLPPPPLSLCLSVLVTVRLSVSLSIRLVPVNLRVTQTNSSVVKCNYWPLLTA